MSSTLKRLQSTRQRLSTSQSAMRRWDSDSLAVDDALDRILDSPTRWRVLDEDVRRCLARVFPYGVLYTIEPEFVLIVAVMHCSREPGYWKRRVAKP